MALQIVADKIDDLPEALREHAKETNGKFAVAALPQGWALEDVTGLKSSLADERKQRKDFERMAKAFEGIDDAEAARSALEQMRAGSLKSSKEIDTWKVEVEKKVMADRKALEGERDGYRTQLEQSLIERDAYEAITKAGGIPRLLMPLVRSAARIERNGDGKLHLSLVGEDGKPLITKKAGSSDGMSLVEFVETLKSQPDCKGAFNGSGATGGGSSSQHGGSVRAAGSGQTLSARENLARAFATGPG